MGCALDKFRTRVAHFRAVSGCLGDRIRAYRTDALSALWYRAQLPGPDRRVAAAAQAAIVSMVSAPMHAFTPDMLEGIAAWGARVATPTIATTAQAAQCRVVAKC